MSGLIWFCAAGGETMDLEHPEKTPILLTTIAKSLSQMNRWAGHSKVPFSVAAHSLIVSELMGGLAPTGLEREYRRAGLLHDAHEAYTTDLPSPHKILLGRVWEDFEISWQIHVLRALGELESFRLLTNVVRYCDQATLIAEREVIHQRGEHSWGEELDGVPVNELAAERVKDFLGARPDTIERLFLYEAKCLGVPGA